MRAAARRGLSLRNCAAEAARVLAAVREGLWRARRLPPFVARRPNLLSYLRRLRLRVASAAV